MGLTASELFDSFQKRHHFDEMNPGQKKEYLDYLKENNHPNAFEEFIKKHPNFFDDIDNTTEDNVILKSYDDVKSKSITDS